MMENITEFLFLKVLLPGLAVMLVLLFFVVLPWGIYESATAETFGLRKDSWGCTKQEVRNTVNTVNTVDAKGNVSMTTVPGVEVVCVQYSMR